jgi:uncharacterized protein
MSFSIWAEEISYEYADKAFLWEVSAKNGKSVYILGSVHFGTKELYPLPRIIQDSFQNSEILVVESDFTKTSAAEMQRLTEEYAYYPKAESLQEHISAGTYEILKKKLNSHKITPESINNLKPWFVGLMLADKEVQKRGFDPDYGIDKHFLRLSDDLGMQVDELEGTEFQFKLFSEFSDELQEDFLKMTMKKQSYNIKGALNAWVKGDPEEMEIFILDEMNKTPKLKPLYDKLIYERNIRMCFKIDEYIRSEKKHFVVVGAGHLVGKEGIIEILKEKGYKVKQL